MISLVRSAGLIFALVDSSSLFWGLERHSEAISLSSGVAGLSFFRLRCPVWSLTHWVGLRVGVKKFSFRHAISYNRASTRRSSSVS